MFSSSTEPKAGYWQDLSRNEKAEKIINDGHLADCKFVVGPENEKVETIHGIKLYFIMESPVFEKMFSGDYLEAQDKSEIRLTDVSPQDFKNLSLMIYTHCASNLSKLSLAEICTLYRLCDKYMISSILQFCINRMKNSDYLHQISIDDLITLFEFARDLEDKSLLQSSHIIIQKRCKTPTNRTNILTEEAFYEYVQILTGSPTVGNFFTKEQKEVHIFSVIDSYFVNNNLLELLHNEKQVNSKDGNNSKNNENDEPMDNATNCELIRKSTQMLLQNVLKLVRFNEMSLIGFLNGPGASTLLDTEQKYYIISQLISLCLCGHNKSEYKRCEHRNNKLITLYN